MSGALMIMAGALPFVALAIGHKVPRIVLFGSVVLACYFLILIGVHFRRNELESAINGFDLDHNGLISGAEDTHEAKQAIAAASADTGLTLAPITGALYSVMWVGLIFVVGDWRTHLRVRRKPVRLTF